MKPFSPIRTLCLLCPLLSFPLFASVASADDNLLANGSFEAPNSTVPYAYYDVGSTAITGWTVVGGQVQLTDGNASGLPASHGGQWMDLTGSVGYNKGLVSDAVSTVVGRTYALSFDLGNYLAPGFGTSTLSVSINGGTPQLFTNLAGAGGGMDWERKTLNWVADAGSVRITFLGVANGALSNDWGIGLDNVSLAALPVPEPEGWAMLLAGLGLTGMLARRRG